MTPDESLEVVWAIVGRFALVEGRCDAMVAHFARDIPSALAKIVLKRLSTDERRRCIIAVLEEKGLRTVYPDLPELFARVAAFRNQVVHSNVGVGLRGDAMREAFRRLREEDETDVGELGWEVSFAQFGRTEPSFVERDALIRVDDDSRRLEGLMETLFFDLHLVQRSRKEGPDGPEDWITGEEVLGPVDPTKPREPMSDV